MNPAPPATRTASGFFSAIELLPRLAQALETAYVIPLFLEHERVYGRVVREPFYEIAGVVWLVSCLDVVLNRPEVLPREDVAGGGGEGCFRLRRLFLEAGYAPVIPKLNDAVLLFQ